MYCYPLNRLHFYADTCIITREVSARESNLDFELQGRRGEDKLGD